MTREEAWRRAKGYLYDALDGEEADEIIKALETDPCNDAISRQYLLDNCVVDKVTMPYVPIRRIQEAPPVIPHQKTGYWIPLGNYDDYGNERSYKCSECGDVDTYPDNHCPECGAKMLTIYKPQAEREET